MTREQAAAAQFGISPSKITTVRRAFKIASDKGTFALKESRQSKTGILFIHAAKEYLYKQGTTNIDRYILSPDESPYVDIDGHLFVMSSWVESREAHYDSPSDVIPAAENLAELHQSARGFAPPTVPERIWWGAWPSLWQERLDKLQQYKTIAEGQMAPSRFERRFLRHIDRYCKQGQDALEILLKSPYAEITTRYQAVGSLCHHDYSERNVLFTGGQSIHLVDFDYCICDLPIHDLVNFLRRLAKFTNYNSHMACRVLTAYLDKNPLPQEELQLFVPLWLWPQKFWEVAHQFYGEKRVRSRGTYLDRLRRRCRTRDKEQRLLENVVSAFQLA
ncbi:MAG: CotS family spore coat protein [Firmicutes bacterium]|nr:CotS family spore coat protein [Bacillota bacterium]